jgi:hypothetical protein
LLATYVALHDVQDAEGFVAATIQRSGLTLTRCEHEELLAEGIAILCELAADFEPHREGYAQAGRFSGYAARYLPRRLGDAWHRGNPHHHRIAGENGKRSWHYEAPPVSLDQLLEPANGGSAGGTINIESAIRPVSQMAQAPARPAGDRA